MRLPASSAVRDALGAALERALETMAAAARETREGATHEDSRAEGDKDMRSTEQSYLARGQAMRVEDLLEQIQRLRVFPLANIEPGAAIVAGALVHVEMDEPGAADRRAGAQRVYFLVPYGGGTVLHVDGTEVIVVAPSSPVGSALLGKRVSDTFELRTRGAAREWIVRAVG